jgi:paraquat-inducible protein B
VDNKKYPVTDNDIPVLKLIQDQEAIGWNQVIKGRWSVEWVKQFESTNPSRGEAIATNLLTQIRQAKLTHWTARCDLQHQKDASPPESCLTDLTQQVQAIYQQKHNLYLIDQQPLNTTIDNIMKMPIHTIRKWIKSTESFVKLGLQRAKKRAKNSNQTITNLFRPTRPRTENNSRNTTIAHTPPTNPEIPLHPNAQENQRPP